MSFEEELAESCENSLRDLEEDSVVFQEKNQIQLVATIDHNHVQLKGQLGRGAFADVRFATIDKMPQRRMSLFSNQFFATNGERKSSRKYAVKGLRSSLRSSELFEGAKDLAREAMFLSALRHPNIIYLHGAASKPGRTDYFLVIEPLQKTLVDQLVIWLSENRTLREKKGRKAKKEMKQSLMNERLENILGLVSALKYMHGKNILFRDLKPANIGFDKHGNVNLFDFGLTTELKEVDKMDDNQYKVTICAGTPRYMASEVYYGKPYGLPVDVYSLSLVLYEVVMLEKAFMHRTMQAHEEMVYCKGKRPALGNFIPKEVKAWIVKGWNNDPYKRPEMGTLHSEITEYLTANGCCRSISEGSFYPTQ